MVLTKDQVSSAHWDATEPTGRTAPQTIPGIDMRSLSTKQLGLKPGFLYITEELLFGWIWGCVAEEHKKQCQLLEGPGSPVHSSSC